MTTLTTRTTSESSANDPIGSVYLSLVLCAERPTAPSSRHCLDEIEEVTIGRADKPQIAREAKALRIGMPDAWMSTAHARLSKSGKKWSIEDRGAKNGCFRNGIKIEKTLLDSGDVLELGHTFFLFRRGPSDESAPADLSTAQMDASLPAMTSLSPTVRSGLEVIRRGAASMMPALILGETGTGKELAAQALHALSGRAGAFVPVNCGALPATLVESELFGYKKGAFSGATADHAGLVRAADGGTLFLDEIGELPLTAQAALLRVLQEKEVRAIGAVRAVSVDVRVVSATHRDLETLAEAGKFRSDLLARVAGLLVNLPPLRERREDLGLMVSSLLKRLGAGEKTRLSIASARALFSRPWKRNVREIEHWLGAALLVAKDGVIEPREERAAPAGVDAFITLDEEPGEPPDGAPLGERDKARKEKIVALLEQHNGNITSVAGALGKAREQVYRWIKRYKIDPEKFRRD